MKKAYFLLLSCFVLCACAGNIPTHIPKKTYVVSYDFGNIVENKVSAVLSSDIDTVGVKFRDKNNVGKEVTRLFAGDKVDVYFNNEQSKDINSAYVTKISKNTIKVRYYVIPGSEGQIDYLIDIPNGENRTTLLDHSDVKYVINEDYSFVDKNDVVPTSGTMFATYEDDNLTEPENSYSLPILKINALYSFDPRIAK